jgi:phage terminase large subunit-like protein
LDRPEKLELIQLLEEKAKRLATRKLFGYYPDDGPLRRELYPKHLEFFKAGTEHRERLFLAANRVGKTEGAGGFEVALHLTGRYPIWWPGRRFDRPTNWWAAGNTGKTTRDIIQAKLFGPLSGLGTGLIPKEDIVGQPSAKQGVPNAFDTAFIKHTSGGVSQLQLKSYDQRRTAFEGTEQDGIWLDEEPPQDIYTECLLRTMTNNGLIMLTFTPLMGMSEVVLSFLPGGQVANV